MRSFARIVAASTAGPDGASVRYRLRPLAVAGRWPVDVVAAETFPTKAEIARLVERAHVDAILLLQRVLPSPEQLDELRTAFSRIVFDLDDAIHAVPPRVGEHVGIGLAKSAARVVRRGSRHASSRSRPLARVLREVDVCVAGNRILAAYAARHARRVVEIPTTIEPLDHPPHGEREPVVVWLGLPDNLQYLDLVRPALERLGARVRIVSSAPWTATGVNTEFVRWSPEASREALVTARVGVAPLTDDPWTRGKCALRAIQYAGHALPVVATPVGITERVVLHGRTGYLARTNGDWTDALRALLDDAERAARMGAAGLEHIRAHYSDRLAVDAWHRVLDSLVETPR